jgi:hypothetical protein
MRIPYSRVTYFGMGINIFVWTYSHGCDNLRLIGVLVESVDGENVASDMRRIGCKLRS